MLTGFGGVVLGLLSQGHTKCGGIDQHMDVKSVTADINLHCGAQRGLADIN
jgi:hypothetical protein